MMSSGKVKKVIKIDATPNEIGEHFALQILTRKMSAVALQTGIIWS